MGFPWMTQIVPSTQPGTCPSLRSGESHSGSSWQSLLYPICIFLCSPGQAFELPEAVPHPSPLLYGTSCSSPCTGQRPQLEMSVPASPCWSLFLLLYLVAMGFPEVKSTHTDPREEGKPTGWPPALQEGCTTKPACCVGTMPLGPSTPKRGHLLPLAFDVSQGFRLGG